MSHSRLGVRLIPQGAPTGLTPSQARQESRLFKPSAKSIQLVPQDGNVRAGETWPHVVVIGIDLGTTRSGIGFAIIPDPQNGKKVEWKAMYVSADSENPSLPEKSETILLHFPKGDEDQIGGAAFIVASESEKPGYYVRDFKMLMDVKGRKLKGEGEISLKKTEVTLTPLQSDVKTPLKMPLIEVVSRFLKVAGDIGYKYLVEEAEKNRWKIKREDINWVITVPAIWTDQARIFMREACLKANLLGTSSNNNNGSAAADQFTSQVGICLEPEGATLHCFACTQISEPKDKLFLVIDLGGGTTDITFHKILSYSQSGGNSRLELAEVEPPSGGPWGGRLIDQSFLDEILTPLIGQPARKALEQYPLIWLNFLIDKFWKTKKIFDGSKPFIFDVRAFCSLFDQTEIIVHENEVLENVKHLKLKYPSHEFIVKGTKVWIPGQILCLTFEPILKPLKAHLDELVKRTYSGPNPKGKITTAFVVGGMSDNPYLKNTLLTHWKQLVSPYDPNSECFFPNQAGTAIVQGAVRFGFDPSPFRMRRARTNYGISCYNRGDPSNSLFSRLVEKGADLSVLAKNTTENPLGPYTPVQESQTRITFSLYESDDSDVKYIKDKSCAFITETELSIDTSLPFSERLYSISLSMDGPSLKGVVTCSNNTALQNELKWSSR